MHHSLSNILKTTLTFKISTTLHACMHPVLNNYDVKVDGLWNVNGICNILIQFSCKLSLVNYNYLFSLTSECTCT